MNISKIATIIALLCHTYAHAQSRQPVNIERVTVFLQNAELESSVKVNIPQGESEFLFTNIAGNILEESISVGADNNVVVLSATPKNDYLSDEHLSPRAVQIRDSIDVLTTQQQNLEDRKTTVNDQIAVLRENRRIGGNNGLSVAELQKMLELIQQRMNGLLSEVRSIDRQSKKLNERLLLLNRQLEEERQRGFQPGGQMLVKFYSTKPTSANVTLSYVVPNAGWTPGYDIRVDKISNPVKLLYKANIYQNTGVKWTNVKLTLSTGNPNEGAEAPVLNPWYLSFYTPQAPVPMYKMNNRAALANTAGEADQSVSTGAGLAPESASLNEYVAINNTGMNTSFDIDIPYTIPSDGQSHIVSVKSYELPATYRYYTVPKMDRDAFLQARVTNWEDLNLLPAPTNIFYEGTYVGRGYIDMRNVKDTLSLSLGRDKKIIVRRENDKNYRSVRMIGSNVRKSYGYTISIRNTKPEPIRITVLEQFPVSNDKDISVEDREAAGAAINDENGAVQWDMSINPAELKTLKLNYTVKYPKDKTINNL